jgi:hypothetical protein
MFAKTTTLGAALAIVSLAACGGSDTAADAERDTSLLPADSTYALSDVPVSDTLPEPSKSQPQTDKSTTAVSQPDDRRPPPPPPPAAGEGTAIELYAADTLQLNDDLIGQTVFAQAATAVLDYRGREVIPAGAVFSGAVNKTEIPDGSGGSSEALILTFNSVEIGGNSYGVRALTDSIGFRTEKGGITAGDVAKTGAGTVVGAIAGRVIGGNRTGTLIGAAVGTVAGAGVAIATKGEKVMIDAGSPIRIVLAEPFVRQP